MQKIVIDPLSKKKLTAKFGDANVSKALSFRSNSPMSKEIRHIAMNDMGGVIITF